VTQAMFAPIEARRTIAVNIPALLTGLVFVSLTFNALVGTMAALLFLAAGLGIAALQPRLAVDAVLRWWIVLVLPAYCVLSLIWSQFPGGTLRYGLQLAATIVIALVIANRVSLRNLIRCLFFALLIGTVLSVGLGRISASGAWLGIFSSKNAFASHIALQLLVSLAILLDGSESRLLRLTAVGAAAISMPLLVLAQSAGVLVVIGPCVAAMLAVAISRHFTGPQKLFLAGLCGLTIVAVGGAAILFADVLLAELLDATGKDVTLTGRTELWAVGMSLIADNPVLGAGYRGFWVQGYAPAERLWALFYVPSGSGFNFHNTYISNAVEIGLLGLSIQLALIYGALLALLWLAVVRPDAHVVFLLGIHMLLVLRSFIEVEVFFEFSLRTVLAVCTFVYAMRLLGAWRSEQLRQRDRYGPVPHVPHMSMSGREAR
jgi:exopolysaccharide production protein ExoQ